ncbi:hypothetical protein HG535_0F02600 [Zygotorulaspora mrakii]|uniref:Protein FMP52, mitochondrial n=1 Tax=Zygotorulaspora mrakii TaxID=42260 RepID=A0A7H9B726_ZYGMR|nr:uncharacterized protein HG535_0F02600 [Zygotorulaspora mrakii]QLG73749.1 hypothetical protein HG535_0F02600 [Zygotorulaspora mrakii]
MNAIVLGATGLCGRSLLKNCESSGQFSKVYTLGRRSLPFDSTSQQLVEKDSKKWCDIYPDDNIKIFFSGLGTTRGEAAGFDNQYRIDHDLNLEVAKVAKQKGCSTIVIVSSSGANENSYFPYLKMKGEIERDIIALDFDRTIILRPGALLGNRSSDKGLLNNIAVKVTGLFYRTRLEKCVGYPVYGDEVGKVGVHLALEKSIAIADKKVRIVESSEILKIANKIN